MPATLMGFFGFLLFTPVYPDGNVCISILHTPGEDPLMYEQASERWSPVQSVEKVILSVISMLAGMCISAFSFIVPKRDRDGAHMHACPPPPFFLLYLLIPLLLLNSPARTEPREWREH
jgi:hypothetical protein